MTAVSPSEDSGEVPSPRESTKDELNILEQRLPTLAVDADTGALLQTALRVVSGRARPPRKKLERWQRISSTAGAILLIVATVLAYLEIRFSHPADWGKLIVMLLPLSFLTVGRAFCAYVGVQVGRFEVTSWNISARLSRSVRAKEHLGSYDIEENPAAGCVLSLGTLSFMVLVVVGGYTASTTHPHHFPVYYVSLVMTLIALGILVGLAEQLFLIRCYRRWFISRAHWGDLLVWNLLDAAASMESPSSEGALEISCLRRPRATLLTIARRIETDPICTASTPWWDRKGRAESRSDHRRIAALVRRHADAVLHARSSADFNRIRDSLHKGLLAACSVEDWPALLTHAPEVRAKPLWAGALRKLVPAALLVATAVALPYVPGLAGAEAFRLPLLLTALVALLSQADAARDVIKDAAGKGMWEGLIKKE
ncbi:hypothetical protein ACIRQQ_14175 [Streptomyces fuscichromogenes]|uniref:hypothetical protein n=1 Tax=Streptomyces fuscichromogenes TaxID=1324013 RepID=UPI0037FD31E3